MAAPKTLDEYIAQQGYRQIAGRWYDMSGDEPRVVMPEDEFYPIQKRAAVEGNKLTGLQKTNRGYMDPVTGQVYSAFPMGTLNDGQTGAFDYDPYQGLIGGSTQGDTLYGPQATAVYEDGGEKFWLAPGYMNNSDFRVKAPTHDDYGMGDAMWDTVTGPAGIAAGAAFLPMLFGGADAAGALADGTIAGAEVASANPFQGALDYLSNIASDPSKLLTSAGKNAATNVGVQAITGQDIDLGGALAGGAMGAGLGVLGGSVGAGLQSAGVSAGIANTAGNAVAKLVAGMSPESVALGVASGSLNTQVANLLKDSGVPAWAIPTATSAALAAATGGNPVTAAAGSAINSIGTLPTASTTPAQGGAMSDYFTAEDYYSTLDAEDAAAGALGGTDMTGFITQPGPLPWETSSDPLGSGPLVDTTQAENYLNTGNYFDLSGPLTTQELSGVGADTSWFSGLPAAIKTGLTALGIKDAQSAVSALKAGLVPAALAAGVIESLKPKTASTTVSYPDWYVDASKSAISLADKAAAKPFQAYDPNNSTTGVSTYMNPYIKGALDPAADEINRKFDMTQNALDAKAGMKNAFGTDRALIERGLTEEARGKSLGALYGTGYANAYDKALTTGMSENTAERGHTKSLIDNYSGALRGAGDAGKTTTQTAATPSLTGAVTGALTTYDALTRPGGVLAP